MKLVAAFLQLIAAIDEQYCNSTELGFKGDLENCLCPNGFHLAHLAAYKSDLALLEKIKNSDCDLTERGADGNNALYHGAQSSNPLKVSKFLFDEGLSPIQFNVNSHTLLHALLSPVQRNPKDLEEILDVIHEYRYRGVDSFAKSRPGFWITVIPHLLRVKISNIFVSYTAIDYLKKSEKFDSDAKDKITNALEKPHEIIEMTVKQKDRNELLATFERQRLEYENKKKRDLKEVQEEMAEKEAKWEQNAKNWKGEMKKMTDQLKEAQDEIKSVKDNFLKSANEQDEQRENDRAEIEELKKKLEKADQDGIQAVEEANDKLQKLTEENSQAIVKIKFDADNRESEYQMKVAELENQLKNYISIEENLQSVIVAQKESLQAEEILKQDLRSKITDLESKLSTTIPTTECNTSIKRLSDDLRLNQEKLSNTKAEIENLKQLISDSSKEMENETAEKLKCLSDLKTKEDSVYELQTLLTVSREKIEILNEKNKAPEEVPTE